MVDLTKLPLFITAALILLLTPGPAVLYIIARSVDQGRLAGLISVLSIEVGNFIHVLAATLGLSALVFSSTWGFTVVKWLGAGYLIYLGIRRYGSGTEIESAQAIKGQGFNRVFSQGVLVAVLNPKTALFFLAFLPQFVDPALGSIPVQFFSLGCIFVLMAIFTDGLYSLASSTASNWLKSNQTFWRVEKIVAGSVYILLGLTAAFSSLPK
jgi:threonine/homoserine/homoserine lactone efflux protein